MRRITPTILLFAVACASGASKGASTGTGPSDDGSNDVASFLFVQNAHEARLQDGRLTMKGVGANAIYFTDRPYRKAGHIPTAKLMKAWSAGDGSFGDVPPNAVLSIFHADGIHDVVVVLRNPKLAGDTITYDVEIVGGKASAAGGPAALFIDNLAPWPAVRHGMHDEPGAKSRKGMH